MTWTNLDLVRRTDRFRPFIECNAQRMEEGSGCDTAPRRSWTKQGAAASTPRR